MRLHSVKDKPGDILLFVDVLFADFFFFCLFLSDHLLLDPVLTPCFGRTEGNPPLSELSSGCTGAAAGQNDSFEKKRSEY